MSDLFGKETGELEERLYHAKDNMERVGICDGFLLGKFSEGIYEVEFAQKLVPALLAVGNIRQVLTDFNVTHKTLERRFNPILSGNSNGSPA